MFQLYLVRCLIIMIESNSPTIYNIVREYTPSTITYVWWLDGTSVAHMSHDEWLGIDLSLHDIPKQQNIVRCQY